MIKEISVARNDIVFFLDVLAKYCIFYFGEDEGKALYAYYYDNHANIIPALKKENRLYGANLFKLHMILKKIEADVFFNNIEIFHLKWPYHKGQIKLIDFELFQLTCFDFYESLGETRTVKEERLKLGFTPRLLEALLPPKKECLFNHEERPNKNTALR